MTTRFVSRMGAQVLASMQMWVLIAGILRGSLRGTVHLTFVNSAVFRVLVRQLYFTAFQAIPVVCAAALIVGSITVNYLLHFLTSLGAYDQIGNYLILSVTHEFAPIICTMILLLRSGSVVLSEIAHMKINRELDTLRMLGVNIENYLYLPRIIAFSIAGPCLAVVFSLVALVGGYFTLGLFHNITFDSYMDQIFDAMSIENFLPFMLKPFFMGLAVVLIAIEKGITVRNTSSEVPTRLIRGMIHISGCLIVIEILFNYF